MSRSRRRRWAALVLGILAVATGPRLVPAQGIDAVRKASVAWERRQGPERQVVDQVCLVPDLPTFLEAVAAWDEHHYFPVLIDDVDLNLKFVRAFRPARIVRYPKKAAPLEPDKLWGAAIAAVGRSWADGVASTTASPPGDAPPKDLGPTPPGVVVSSPQSATLAGAVALAAGRFQPLLRWDIPQKYGDMLSEKDAQGLSLQLEKAIADLFPRYDQLGDDCDFITLAGDWPYRYDSKDGPRAFDDLIGRFPGTHARWAYAGRLTGALSASVYQAMCSLFLQPRSAVLVNKYSEKDRPWSDYSMTRVVERLGALLPVTHRSGTQAGLAGWHEVFDPKNRFGLVMVNTHGEPTRFHLTDGPAHTADVPPSVPAVVLIIHSFSAANPSDPDTLAGRWLANGAYVYYGSMNEPYLEAFRTPRNVASLIADHLPLAAVMRQSPPEVRGQPWRLLYLGDPLYRIEPDRKSAPRLVRWGPVADWPEYVEFHPPDAGTGEDLRLNWALKTALFRAQHGIKPQLQADLPAVLMALARSGLKEPMRPLYDALLIDTMLQARRPLDLLGRLIQVPAAHRSPLVRRTVETLQMARLQKLVASHDFPGATAFWGEIVRSGPTADFLQQVTARAGTVANEPARLGDWRARLRTAEAELKDTPGQPVVSAELKRVKEKLNSSKPR